MRRSTLTRRPVSSRASRIAPFAGSSPASAKPPGMSQYPLYGARSRRTNSTLPPLSIRTPTAGFGLSHATYSHAGHTLRTFPANSRRPSLVPQRGQKRERSARLVLEMTAAGEQHRHAVLVRRVDHHRVAERATGLDDRGDAGPCRDLDAVGEREVRVGCHDRKPRVLPRLPYRDLDRDNA